MSGKQNSTARGQLAQYAKDFHCAYSDLYRVIRLPGAPVEQPETGFDKEEVRAFYLANTGAKPQSDGTKSRKARAQARLAEIKTSLGEIELAVAEKKVVSLDSLNTDLGLVAARMRAILQAALVTQGERYSGMSPVECREHNKGLVDSICAEMQRLMEDYAK